MSAFGNITTQREVLFSSQDFNLISGTTPTTTAATISFLSGSGNTFATFTGGTADKAGVSISFKIPSNYISDGEFWIRYTSDSSALNARIQAILTQTAIGDNLSTETETGIGVTAPMTTSYLLQEFKLPITTELVIENNISLRVYRLGNDALDTSNLNFYISQIIFKYVGL